MDPFRCAGGVAPGYHMGRSAAWTVTFREAAFDRAKLDSRGRLVKQKEVADIIVFVFLFKRQIRFKETI